MEDDIEIQEDSERRYFVIEELRVLDADGEPKSIEGYAAVFNKRSEVMWDFTEQIEPGFFAPALKQDVRALWNHNTDLPLGRTKNKTLSLTEDERGLMVKIVPPDTQWGRDAVASIKRGDVTQMSFGFSVRKGGDEWSSGEKGLRIRTLKAGGIDKLYDVSPVTFPAYPQTSAQVRAMVESMKGQADSSAQSSAPQDDMIGEPGQDPGEDETQKAKAQARRNLRTRKIDLIK